MLRFASIGVCLALAVNLFWSTYKSAIPAVYYLPTFKASLLLFPAYIGSLAQSGASYWSAGMLGLIALNGITFAGIGLLTWLGLRKNKTFFILEAVVVAVFVGAVWTLH